ncbi:Hypothetical protein Tpal_1537 [Trichococcus palustris]|uniref:Uncharacterized protein n=1 Tax=Trichococcus palustris TaxID=140314 RepID=A0A143YKE6_9LACT|nr:Hypothetical protein Tpal_1537 [Trichococcus palustris]SFL06053.1 hypothetical protein SAMN04488076_11643 [Trichococcus palustris]
MSILRELIIRSVLVVALNDAIIFYWISKNSRKITVPLAIGIIVITCIALVINIWYCLYRRGIS